MFFQLVFLSVFSLACFAETTEDNFDDLLKTLNRNPPGAESLPAPDPLVGLKPSEAAPVRESGIKPNSPIVQGTSEQVLPSPNSAPAATPESIVPDPVVTTPPATATIPETQVYGPQTAPPQSGAPSFLVPQSDEFGDIYMAMLFLTNQRGQAYYAPGVGHSVAAATLVVCAPELSPVERLHAMHSVLNHLERVRVRSIAMAVQTVGRTWHPLLTQIAATLVCKMRNRLEQKDGQDPHQKIVQELMESSKELVGRFNARRSDIRLEESLSNLLAAATLMN
jgi:hypothetical protein